MIGDASFQVECDDCGEVQVFTLAAFCGAVDLGKLAVALKEEGWEVVGRDEHYCPECHEARTAASQEEE